ncbi:MAG: TIGR01459 family HAD-type hydrolase [Pseudomonadota bacterium]
MTEIIESFADIAGNYDAAFVDLWGCLHNGKAPFPGAVDALGSFVEKGGFVVLLTNSPRPRGSVAVQLDGLSVPRNIWHTIATSGDGAKAALGRGEFGTRIYHLGPDRDAPFFEPDPETPGIEHIQRVPLADAEAIVCTGPFDDDIDTPEDYDATFLSARNRGLPFLCANPDLVVDHGETRKYCAGALAEAYAARGGAVHFTGKPHPVIYDLARQRLTQAAGRVIDDSRVICLGDGVLTDVPGAAGEALDCLFISGGLAAAETATGAHPSGQPNPEELDAFLRAHNAAPRFTIGYLR